MMIRVGACPHEGAQLVISLHVRSRHQFLLDPTGESSGAQYLARNLDTLYESCEISFSAQVVRVHQRLSQWVLAGQPDPAARQGTHNPRQDADRVGVPLADDNVRWHMDESKLEIW